MQKVRIVKTGEVKVVENNVAHGLIEKGVAVLAAKAFTEAPRDKMISEKRKKVRRK